MSMLQQQTKLKLTSNEDQKYHNTNLPKHHLCDEHSALVNVTGLNTVVIEFFYIKQAQYKNCQSYYHFKTDLSPLTDI